ncbi:MAG: hypothetical protein ABJP79_18340 [Tateyamaria sp.]|uniref:hypothetical protein n=1 Tax=Tateyamaria sp. TaxID=1929288 RepID=UPI0032A1263C
MTQALRTPTEIAFAPGQVLRVYGMRRSGNHALIDWIMRNAKGGAGVFLNNCRPGRDPMKSKSALSLFENGKEVEAKNLRAKLQKAGNAPFAVVSYEDAMPPKERKPLYDAPEQCIVIYRSFLHWSASLLRKIQGNTGYGPLERMRVMMQAMRTYNQMLGRVRDTDVVPLCYDDWVSDETYRRTALDRIGLPGRNLGLGQVQRYGGGSSFQGRKAEVADLATTERSMQMAADLEYQLVLWTAARDLDFMLRLADVFPKDAERLSKLLETATAQVTLS